jgi:hypothetical protein
MGGKATPLYVVCSPARSDGRTLVSRLLTEFYVLGDQPVAAFDLCDEGPQLADYLPHLTTISDINDIRDQMKFFERLIAEDEGAKIIDVSHRIFKNFFITAQKIGFFEEARHHSIVPLILLAVDAHPKSSEICATLRRCFPETLLLPVRNVTERIAISGPDMPAKKHTTPASLDVPFLRPSLRRLIDGQNFSFSEFWRARAAKLPDASDDEVLDWLMSIYFQFQDIEVWLGFEDNWTQIPAYGRVRVAHHGQRRDAQPLSRSKFAPKKSDQYPITELQKMTVQLQAAEERISVFETAIKQWQNRAARAETQLLKLIQNQIKR